MTHDTTKDPRILTAQLACAVLKNCVKQKSKVSLPLGKDRLAALAAECESAVMTLLYLYQDPAALAASEPAAKIAASAAALEEAYQPLVAHRDASLKRANVRWCLRTLGGFRDRLGNAGATLASGVDLMAVAVRHVKKSGNFWETAVSDGHHDYTVVTNLGDVKSATVLAVAFLPPREIGGTVSEAMFLGSEKRLEEPGTLLAEDQADAREAAGILYEELARHPK
jgi:predicted RNA-binding protein with EMAP domain